MKTIINKRIHLDNGFDYFFSDDSDYGFSSVESAIKSGYNLCVDLKSDVRVVYCVTFDNEDYKDEVIAKFNYRNIIKSENNVKIFK